MRKAALRYDVARLSVRRSGAKSKHDRIGPARIIYHVIAEKGEGLSLCGIEPDKNSFMGQDEWVRVSWDRRWRDLFTDTATALHWSINCPRCLAIVRKNLRTDSRPILRRRPGY